jgi:hypothetical protein
MLADPSEVAEGGEHRNGDGQSNDNPKDIDKNSDNNDGENSAGKSESEEEGFGGDGHTTQSHGQVTETSYADSGTADTPPPSFLHAIQSTSSRTPDSGAPRSIPKDTPPRASRDRNQNKASFLTITINSI